MKTTTTKLALALAAILTVNYQLSICFAQGSLTPPGAPAPAMKSLDQIEPRTPIPFLPYYIFTAGSYYVVSNLTGIGAGNDGIVVAADDVTVDLNGFTLFSGGSGGSGVHVGFGTHTNLWVRNGTLKGWGTAGVDALNATGSQFDHIQVYGNGGNGMTVGSGSTIKDSTAQANGLIGISAGNGAAISHCFALTNGSYGFDESYDGGVFDACVALNNANTGFHVGGSRVVNCIAKGNGLDGIDAYNGSLVSGCLCSYNVLSGISLGMNSVALDNDCVNNNSSASVSDAGILQFFGPGRIEGNHISYGVGVGITVSAGQTKVVVIRNTTAGNTNNAYSIPAGNDVGPWGQAATATSPWANIRN